MEESDQNIQPQATPVAQQSVPNVAQAQQPTVPQSAAPIVDVAPESTAPLVEASSPTTTAPVAPVTSVAGPVVVAETPQVDSVQSAAPTNAVVATTEVVAPQPASVSVTNTPAEPIVSLTTQPPVDANQYMPLYVQAIQSIIQSQENIVGPVALDRARQVQGLEVDWSTKAVTISGDPSVIVDQLVQQYEQLFGQISVEVCREAAHRFTTQLPADKAPQLLR